jgi:hypothetical protein
MKEFWSNFKMMCWLIKELFKSLFQFDYDGLLEAYYLLKLHISHDCKRIK